MTVWTNSLSHVHGCWLLFITVITRFPAVQAAVPPPVLNKADPSAPQVFQSRLLWWSHVEEGQKFYLRPRDRATKEEDWISSNKLSILLIKYTRLMTQNLSMEYIKKTIRVQTKEKAQAQAAVRMTRSYSNFEFELSLERSRVQFSSSLEILPKRCSCSVTHVGG